MPSCASVMRLLKRVSPVGKFVASGFSRKCLLPPEGGSYRAVANVKVVLEEYSSPGLTMVDGNFGLLGESG